VGAVSISRKIASQLHLGETTIETYRARIR